MIKTQSTLKVIVAVALIFGMSAFSCVHSPDLGVESRSHEEWAYHAAALEHREDWHGLRDWHLRWTRSETDNPIAWAGLGHAYIKLESPTEAVDAYREAIRIFPGYSWTWYNLGVVYEKLSSPSDAIEAYSKAVRINPQFAEAWKNLAIAYDLTGNRDAAMDALKELRRHDPAMADELFDVIVPR